MCVRVCVYNIDTIFWYGRLSGQSIRRVILHLLEYPKQADTQVEAVHDQTQVHKADKCDLVMAYTIPGLTGPSAEMGHRRHDAREVAEPTCR